MAKIDRYNGNMEAFAADALSTERTIFGDTTQSDTLDANITMDLLRGWGVIGVASNPTKQHFNGLAFTLGQLIAYLHQVGIPEWNALQEFHSNSITQFGGAIYFCNTDDHVSATDPSSDTTNWDDLPTRLSLYTQAEVDASLLLKANIDNTYTQGDVDGLIATRTESPDETTVTGTATFTNSTNNIALTGIGSIGLEIGDVVQVTGTASNNKLFTVEVITDSDNIIFNQPHAGETPTTKNKSFTDETVSCTVTLICKWFNASDSLGRYPIEVTRTKNVTYTNATNRGFELIFTSAVEAIGAQEGYIRIDGTIALTNGPVSNKTTSTCTIPRGSEYDHTVKGGGSLVATIIREYR